MRVGDEKPRLDQIYEKLKTSSGVPSNKVATGLSGEHHTTVRTSTHVRSTGVQVKVSFGLPLTQEKVWPTPTQEKVLPASHTIMMSGSA